MLVAVGRGGGEAGRGGSGYSSSARQRHQAAVKSLSVCFPVSHMCAGVLETLTFVVLAWWWVGGVL